MGVGMASRLLAAGHEVKVYNRSPEKAAPLVNAGAMLAATARTAAEGADAIIAMVADDDASRTVWLGETGALAARTAPGAFAIECSTLSHTWVLELAKLAAAQGFRYLDAPVTGLPSAAAAGELILFIGAASVDLDAARPLLAPLCADIVHFGDPGAGTAYKLIQNLMGSIQIASTAEALRTAELSGLDLPTVVAMLSRSGAASPTVIRLAHLMLTGNHTDDIAFTAALRRKDTRVGVDLAESLSAPTSLGRAALHLFDDLIRSGHADLNESKIIDLLRE